MRLAIFSDVHGNFHALQAVLADIEKSGPFDHIVFAGDLVWGAATPVECIEALRKRRITGVYGNTDEYVLKSDKAEFRWVREKIGDTGVKYLQRLPFEQRFSPTNRPEDDLLVVHANPKDVESPIFPSEHIQLALKDKISQTDSEVEPLLENVSAKTIAFGHVHIPNIRYIRDYTLVNIASISRPQDNDPRSKYGVLTFERGQWQVQHCYIDYDRNAAREAILKSDMPDAQKAAEALL